MAIPGYNEPFPDRDAIVKDSGKASDVFVRWITNALLRRLESTPVLAEPLEVLNNQNTTVTGTIGGLQSGGLYIVAFYVQLLIAAGVSSGIQLTLTWTFNGIAQTETFPNLTTNLITSHQGLSYPIRIAPNTSVTYTLTYASNPAGAMRYSAALGLTLLQPIGG